MAIVKFDPLDVLFFGSAQSKDFWTPSTLPSPLTLYGCMGNYILQTNEHSKFDKNTKHSILGQWNDDLNLEQCKIHALGPWFIKNNIHYWPAPAHLFYDPENLTIDPVLLAPDQENEKEFNDLEYQLLKAANPDFERGGVWLRSRSLRDVLHGNANTCFDGNKKALEDDLMTREGRYGHRIDPTTQVVEEGMLFALEVLDFRAGKKTTALAMQVTGDINCISNILARTGGEGHQSKITISENANEIPTAPNINALLENQGKFLLYLATPAIFKNGWLPKDWSFEAKVQIQAKREEHLPESPEKCRLIAIALDKPQIISGFQSAGKTERPIYRQTPGGAVYFFQAPKWWGIQEFNTLITEVHGKQSQSEIYPAAGFGMPLIGLWPNND